MKRPESMHARKWRRTQTQTALIVKSIHKQWRHQDSQLVYSHIFNRTLFFFYKAQDGIFHSSYVEVYQCHTVSVSIKFDLFSAVVWAAQTLNLNFGIMASSLPCPLSEWAAWSWAGQRRIHRVGEGTGDEVDGPRLAEPPREHTEHRKLRDFWKAAAVSTEISKSSQLQRLQCNRTKVLKSKWPNCTLLSRHCDSFPRLVVSWRKMSYLAKVRFENHILPPVYFVFLMYAPDVCGCDWSISFSLETSLRCTNDKQKYPDRGFHPHFVFAASAMSLRTWSWDPSPQQGRGVSVRAPQAIPEREVLSIVVDEVEVMVHVVGSTVNQTYQRARDAVISVVYGNGPKVDEDKEWEVHHLCCQYTKRQYKTF